MIARPSLSIEPTGNVSCPENNSESIFLLYFSNRNHENFNEQRPLLPRNNQIFSANVHTITEVEPFSVAKSDGCRGRRFEENQCGHEYDGDVNEARPPSMSLNEETELYSVRHVRHLSLPVC